MLLFFTYKIDYIRFPSGDHYKNDDKLTICLCMYVYLASGFNTLKKVVLRIITCVHEYNMQQYFVHNMVGITMPKTKCSKYPLARANNFRLSLLSLLLFLFFSLNVLKRAYVLTQSSTLTHNTLTHC